MNAIGTAVPDHDMHAKFVNFAPMLLPDARQAGLLRRMATRSGIEHRASILAPHPDEDRIDRDGFYRRGAFPDTRRRMALYEEHALPLALQAVEALGREAVLGVTHLMLTSCTGFTGPGVDFRLAEALGLARSVERTMIGFMGCSAALNALKAARHVVRSEPGARVLVVNVELCTLHFQDTTDLEEMLSYLIFADGCAACLVSAEPGGIELGEFRSTSVPDTSGQITWQIGEAGFVMHLSGELPASVRNAMDTGLHALLGDREPGEIGLWAVHPGGRSILDAVERSLGGHRLTESRAVLRQHGNMSSPTVMFVLQRMLRDPAATGDGCMLAFGPGITVEAGRFRKAA